MKRLLLIVMGVLLCTPLYSDMNPYIYGVAVASAPAGASYIVTSDLESQADDEKWTNVTGTPNYDQSTAGLSLEGSECMSLAEQQARIDLGSTYSDVYISYMFRMEDTAATNTLTIRANDDTQTYDYVFIAGHKAAGRKLYCLATGGTEDVGTTDLSADTTYYIQWRIQVDSEGAATTVTGWISTDGSTWNQECQSSDGTETTDVRYIHLDNDSASVWYFDDFRTDNVMINY